MGKSGARMDAAMIGSVSIGMGKLHASRYPPLNQSLTHSRESKQVIP